MEGNGYCQYIKVCVCASEYVCLRAELSNVSRRLCVYAFLSSTVYKRGNFEDILKNVSN